MSQCITFKYSKEYPEDLFEFLEFYENNRGKKMIDLRPFGLAFREVNTTYKKAVDVFLSTTTAGDTRSHIVEIEYVNIVDLENKLAKLQ